MTTLCALVLLLASANPAPDGGSPPQAPPRAAKRPEVSSFHGVEVMDPYRWLEKAQDPEVRSWSEAQAAAARAWLDGLPHAGEIRAQVADIVKARSTSWFGLADRPTGLFALQVDPKLQQPQLVLLPSAEAPERVRVLVDPNVLDKASGTTIDFFVPSLDGRKVAVSLSRGGTESGDVQVYDVGTGKPVSGVIPRVNGGTAGGSVAWNADGTGFWYTRYPHPGERPAEDLGFYQQVWFHRLDAPGAADKLELGPELPRIAEIRLATKRDGKWVLAEVRNGDGGEIEYWLRPAAKGSWKRLSAFQDKVVGADFGEGPDLFLLSREGAPRGKVLRLSLPPPAAKPLAAARLVVPEGDGAIQGVVPTRSRLYVEELEGGPSRLRITDLSGRAVGVVPILPVSAVGQVVRTGADDVLFLNTSYLVPAAWYHFAAAKGTVARTRLFQTSPVDLSGAEVVRGFATSKDGTRVPVDVLRMKGTKLDGERPTILYGYGGYGISQVPAFNSVRALWLLNGGIYAVASIRGGGEYGEAWHLGGNLTRKQNGFDDFLAAADWLVAERYTRPGRLGILGGSNGGLLMGAALTQRPEMFRAVVSAVGIADMVRVETTPNGAFNITEYGTVRDPDQFKALYAYSPYHHVKDGVPYPAVLLTAGENDPRVDAWHAKKMAARLQEATASGLPVLLRLSGWGHGMGSSRDEVIAQTADFYAFFFHELGGDFHPIAVSPPPPP